MGWINYRQQLVVKEFLLLELALILSSGDALALLTAYGNAPLLQPGRELISKEASREPLTQTKRS